MIHHDPVTNRWVEDGHAPFEGDGKWHDVRLVMYKAKGRVEGYVNFHPVGSVKGYETTKKSWAYIGAEGPAGFAIDVRFGDFRVYRH